MVFTVNSSAGAFAALQNLQKSGRGLKAPDVVAAKEVSEKEAAVSVDEKTAKDPGGLGAVVESLTRAQGAAQVAFGAADKVGDLLQGLQEKAQKAQQEDVSDEEKAELDAAFQAQRDEISTVIDGADFHGFNAVKAGGQPILAIASQKGDRVVEISPQDLSLGGPNVSLKAGQTLETPEAAAEADAALAVSIERVDQIAGAFEDGVARIQSQIQFVDKLSSTIEQGVGNLVDVGLERESASLQALHVKQQLGIQDLSIANQSPQAILSLFK
ncbi:MAG: flagellin [Alphaproteobacteria bacterium]|nr:flagellin [Alphaproteobacteria bacterium]